MHITLRHKSARGRSTTMAGVLLAIILPASLIMGGLAMADTASGGSSVPEPTRLEQTAAGQQADPSANAPTLPATPASPQSPLPSPSPLNTASPLTTSQPAPKKPGDTGIQSKSADSQPQTRAAYTVTFSDPEGNTRTPSQSVPGGGQASRPKDPSRDGYLFNGWFTGNTAYDFSQPVTGSITLTAKWTRITSSWSLKPTSGPAEGGTRITLTTPTTSDIRLSHISAGTEASQAIGSDGNVYGWGRLSFTQPSDRPGIVTPPTGVSFTQISGGLGFALALGSDGNLYSWGSDLYGEMGRGDVTYSPQLGKVIMPTDGTKFTQFSAGFVHSLAIGSDGNLYSWGYNNSGQLGNGTTDSSRHGTPSKVAMPAGVTKFTQISAGNDHSLALDSDGNLYSWGYNMYGQLGKGNSDFVIEQLTPSKGLMPADGTKFTQISAGYKHSLALGTDGNVYSWGDNSKSQLGRTPASGTQDSTPRKVNPPTGVRGFTQVIAGSNHSLALGSDGNLYSWGDNSKGQLGRSASGTQDGTPGKVTMPGGITITQASAEGGYLGDFSLALGSDGNLYSWGSNSKGQLGRTPTSATPASRPGMVAFPESPRPTGVKFGGTAGTSLTDNKDGTWSVTTPQHAGGKTDVTVSWSRNGPQPDAHLDYTYINPHTVTFDSAGGNPVPDPQRITIGKQATRPITDPAKDGFLFDGWFLKDANGKSDVAYDFSQPVTADITLVAHWSPANTGGWSISPDKGNVLGGQQATITPPKLSRGIRFNQISASSSISGFSIGVASDGNAYAWGDNEYGQLGQDPDKTPTQKTPVRIPLPDGVASGFTYTQAAAGGNHMLAIGSDGIVYSWGINDRGQLGNGSKDTQHHSKPQPVKGVDGQPFKAVQVSAGYADSAAISPDGRVYTWGSEYNADGSYSTSKLAPALAKDPNGSGQGLHAVQVSVYLSFIMALDADGNVYTWGYNNYGQLGNGTATGEHSTIYAADPARVPDPEDTSKTFKATQVSAGAKYAMALSQDGTLWTWGYNYRGQLGDGTKTNRPSPKQIQDPANPTQAFQAVQISAGVDHSLAIDRSGAVWAWGSNYLGPLGNNTSSDQPAPTRVSPPAGQGSAGNGLIAARISAGWDNSMAIAQDGNAYSMGSNWFGQLGNTSIPTGEYKDAAKSLVPVPVALDPQLLITGVKFDKTDVDHLQQNSDGSVTLATPAHSPGLADVVVDWTLGGVGQTQVHLAYTYEGTLPLTGGNGSMILLLAAGLLAAAGAAAAGRHRRETRALHV